MKINAKLGGLSLDIVAYRAALKQTLAQAIHQAAFHWIQTVAEAIPSWSGASRATLLHLASQAGTQVDITISSTAPYDRIGLGSSAGSGDINLEDVENGKVSFNYSTTLPHLIFNEFNNANFHPTDRTKWKRRDGKIIPKLIHPGPYNFQAKGRAAVAQVFKEVRLPDPRQFIKAGKARKV